MKIEIVNQFQFSKQAILKNWTGFVIMQTIFLLCFECAWFITKLQNTLNLKSSLFPLFTKDIF